MNLSNRMTISLASLILLMAFAALPSAMAAEGGPTITDIELDDTNIPADPDGADDDPATTADNIPNPLPTFSMSSSTKYALLTNSTRTAYAPVDGSANGFFRVIVTFSDDVYDGDTARPDQEGTDNSSTRDIAADNLSTADLTIIGAGTIRDNLPLTGSQPTIQTVTRVQTKGMDTSAADDDEYSPNKFLVTIQVPSDAIYNTSDNMSILPISIGLKVNVDVIFGIGSNAGLVKGSFQPDTPGLGNQESGQYDFTVLPRPLSRLDIGGMPTEAIKTQDRVTLTLTFSPGLALADVPTRENIMVTNGDILEDEEDTMDMDEGIKDVSPTGSPRTKYELTIIPEGGRGDVYDIILKNKQGTAFTLMETIPVNNLPPSQRIDITNPDPVPNDGEPFRVNIVYTVIPATNLTVEGITVENGSIVDGSFNGPGPNGRAYSIQIDPDNPTVDNPVTVTVRVGQDLATFTTSVAGTVTTPTTEDPHEPTTITLVAGLNAKSYMVVTPAMIVYDNPATTDVDESMNTDVLPTALAAAKRETATTMPDLEDMFYSGGTVDVYVNAGDGNATADIIINEVMWALDENEVGTDGHTAHQWIELYNNSENNAAAGTITLWFKPRALSGVPTDKGILTDRLSNVLRFGTTTGWRLGDNHGQSGNSDPESTKEFISMYRKADKRGDNDGINGANWIESTELSHVKHRGTPGEENKRTIVPVSERQQPSQRNVPKDQVIINEVYNAADDMYDWIELRALKDTNLNQWTLSYTKSDFTEHSILTFPNKTIKAGEVWLFVNKDPDETNLARGQNLDIPAANNQARGAGPHKYLIMTGNNKVEIPNYNNGTFYLILRTAKGWERWGSGDRIHDVAGPARFARKTLTLDNTVHEPHTGNPGNIWETDVWPLNGYNTDKPQDHYLQTDRTFAEGKVWKRNGTNHGWRKDGGGHTGFEGGLGYDRSSMGAGTPGYHNNVVKAKHTDLANGKVIVSELMLTTDNGRYPQWIELHNTSKENTVDLHADTDGNGPRNGWSIRVENHRSGSWESRRNLNKLHAEVKFSSLGVRFIPPNQTILITADQVLNSGTQSSAHFPDHRVGRIWGLSGNPFDMESRRDTFLNAEGGFLLEIVDGNGAVSDAVGNLDGKKPDIFDTTNVDFDDPYSWNWPTDLIDNRRTSLIRLRDKDANGNNVARPGVPDRTVEGDMTGAVLPLGTKWRGAGKVGEEGEQMLTFAKYAKYAWVRASDTKMAKAKPTWYGTSSDISTPGHTTNTPLPVSLSFFRPTLEDGQVVIRWTTESELDNAGFNIHRSDTRDGEFKQVNEQMIQGKGTTAERSTYKWVDTTAKPGAVYYYQIEDVSLAGEHNTLTTTKLKGLISAKGKLTTQWGTLKNLR